MRGAEQTVLFCYFNSPLGMISNFGTLLKAEVGSRKSKLFYHADIQINANSFYLLPSTL